MIVLGVVFGGMAIGILAGGLSPTIDFSFTPITILMIGVLIVTAACLWVVIMHPNLLYKLVALSPVGLFVALFFVLYKSPDLALTQLMVEVVTLLVFLILLWRLPALARREVTGISTPIRFAIAITVGLVIGLLGLTGYQSPYRSQRVLEGWPSVKDYYVENTKYPAMAASVAEGRQLAAERVASEGYPAANPARSGGGNNAVNVILVDFRAIDTLGEILVLGIAGLGVLVMLTHNRKRSRNRPGSERANTDEAFLAGKPIISGDAWSGPSLILSEIGRLTPAAMLVFGSVIFWVGHNAPGGGFIAGLMASVAITLLFLSFKPGRVQKLHTERYIYLIPVGMLLAIATGLAAVVFEAPFLTSAFVYIKSNIFGTTGLSTALGFDLGVFMVVVGMTMLIIEKFRSEAS
jgi:multisubunit Na+/H+ antiporter MnhB subunit